MPYAEQKPQGTISRVAAAVKDAVRPAETHHSRVYHRWLKLGSDGSVHEFVLSPADHSFVEFPTWEPTNQWAGKYFVTKDEVLVLTVGEYEVRANMRSKDVRGYYRATCTHAGQAYGEYKLVPLV